MRGRGVLPTRRSVLKDGLWRVAVPNGARAHKPEGMESLVQASVGAQGGPAGDSNPQRPGLTSLRGRGVLPKWRSVLKDALRRVAFANGLGSPD